MKKMRVPKRTLLLIKYLEEEYRECREICDTARLEFELEIRKLHHDINVFDESLDAVTTPPGFYNSSQAHESKSDADKEKDPVSSECDQQNKREHSHPPWVKKLFKKIVFLTHPDKLPNGLSTTVKNSLLEMYQLTKEAMDIEDYVSVAIIANDLDVKPIEIDKNDIHIFKKKENTIKSEIKAYKMSIFWSWAHSTDDQKKHVINEFLRSRGWTSAENMRKKSKKGPGVHPGKSISWVRKLGKKS